VTATTSVLVEGEVDPQEVFLLLVDLVSAGTGVNAVWTHKAVEPPDELGVNGRYETAPDQPIHAGVSVRYGTKPDGGGFLVASLGTPWRYRTARGSTAWDIHRGCTHAVCERVQSTEGVALTWLESDMDLSQSGRRWFDAQLEAIARLAEAFDLVPDEITTRFTEATHER
jgi:hypothetical protein